jgi:hypothetical protein
MGKTTDSPAGGQKMIPADYVSFLLVALGCTSISREQLNMMSALDGTRTASSFEHQFRSISAKAKELKKRADQGEKFTPVQPGQKRGVQQLRRLLSAKHSILTTSRRNENACHTQEEKGRRCRRHPYQEIERSSQTSQQEDSG